MPIVYAPPSPVGNFPGISEKGGEAEAIIRMLPTMQRGLEAYMEAQSRNAASLNQLGAENARLREHALDREQRGFLAREAINARLAEQAMQNQGHQANIEAQIQGQMRLNAAQLTQKEQMRRLQMRSSLAEISEMETRGEILPQQAEEMRAKAMGVLGPLERREAEASVMLKESMLKQREDEAKRIEEMYNQQVGNRLGFWHQTVNRVAGVQNPTPGGIRPIQIDDVHSLVIGPDGKSHLLKRESVEAAQQEMMQKRFDTIEKMKDSRLKRWDSVYDGIVSRLDKLNANPETRLKGTEEDFQNTVKQELHRHGLSATRQEEEQKVLEEMGLVQPRPQGGSDAPAKGQSRGTATLGQPFDLADPKIMEKVSPVQRQVLAGFNSQVIQAEDTGDPEVVQTMRSVVGRMRLLFAQYGDLNAMPPEIKKQWDRYDKDLDNLKYELDKRKKAKTPNIAPVGSLFHPFQK